VVLGSRGGGFARLMLGSTSNQVVGHSAAPVVVIPAGR
jgi:nucleotide-binding universal stress UspA family protein